MKYKNDHSKIVKEEYKSKFDDYRDIDEEQMNNHINRKLGELPIHQLLKQLSVNALLWVYDANRLYPSAMSDEKSIYPKKETEYAYTKDMNDELVEKCNNQTIT